MIDYEKINKIIKVSNETSNNIKESLNNIINEVNKSNSYWQGIDSKTCRNNIDKHIEILNNVQKWIIKSSTNLEESLKRVGK